MPQYDEADWRNRLKFICYVLYMYTNEAMSPFYGYLVVLGMLFLYTCVYVPYSRPVDQLARPLVSLSISWPNVQIFWRANVQIPYLFCVINGLAYSCSCCCVDEVLMCCFSFGLVLWLIYGLFFFAALRISAHADHDGAAPRDEEEEEGHEEGAGLDDEEVGVTGLLQDPHQHTDLGVATSFTLL
jgi:hypothetical protein